MLCFFNKPKLEENLHGIVYYLNHIILLKNKTPNLLLYIKKINFIFVKNKIILIKNTDL
jgi:hypothetical protein